MKTKSLIKTILLITLLLVITLLAYNFVYSKSTDTPKRATLVNEVNIGGDKGG